MAKKRVLSRLVRFFRVGVKQAGAFFSAKLFGKKSYPFFGVPSGLTKHEEVKKTLYPQTALFFTPPKSVEKELYWYFEQLLNGMEIPEHGVLTFSHATATSLGGNLTSKGKLITTFLQPIDGKPHHQHDLFRFSTRRFFPRIYKADKPVITLAAGWQGAFYHWVYEVLPRLHLIKQAGYPIDRLFVDQAFSFQKQSLELLGVCPDQIISAKEYAAVQAPQLIIPSIPQVPTQWGCAFLREQILPKLEKRNPLKLYVSRNDATRRRILNETEVFELLKERGFKKAELSKLSFKEQAELFASATAVVGPHGAGFSHLVFCAPTTPILEIFSPAYFHACYWHVASRIGLDYHYLIGEGKRYPKFVDPHIDPDIEVDLKKLSQALELIDDRPDR